MRQEAFVVSVLSLSGEAGGRLAFDLGQTPDHSLLRRDIQAEIPTQPVAEAGRRFNRFHAAGIDRLRFKAPAKAAGAFFVRGLAVMVDSRSIASAHTTI